MDTFGAGEGSGEDTNVMPAKKIQNQRRMSAAPTTTPFPNNPSGSSCAIQASSTAIAGNTKENKRPLSAVLSEDRPSTSIVFNNNNNQQQQQQQQQQQPIRQSFLSKLTRAEGNKRGNGANNNNSNLARKDLKKIDTSHKGASTAPSENSPPNQPQTSSFVYGTECDKFLNSESTTTPIFDTCKTISDLEKSSTTDVSIGEPQQKYKPEMTKNKPTEPTQSIKNQTSATLLDVKMNPVHRDEDEDEEEEDDDDNQVIPSWPSRSEAPKRNSEFIQHKVYSLKDYSQVASPTIPPTSALSISRGSLSGAPMNAGKLQKSMSQDRKVKANAKRMSECIYTSQAGNSSQNIDPQTSKLFSQTIAASAKQQNPSQTGQSMSASFSMAPGGTLLPNTRHAVLLNESRIDRMRKLFVSPLSLRSGSKVSAGNTSSASSQPRLSFQAGTSVLNKPHHLMHAMYRTGVSSAHHSRLSPMRKQGKSFRVYGCPLQMANDIYPITCFGRADIYKRQSVPYILARLCNYIEENSSQLTHEGIFRVSGNARLMEKLRTLFDHLGDAPLESESVDVATSASMLKMYLRELPEPLIPTRMNYYFITLAKKYSLLLTKDNVSSYKVTNSGPSSSTTETSENQALHERQRLAFSRDLTKLLRKLPIENYNLLKYLACFLYRISLKQQYNKMCAEALGIVFGPNVFRIRSESYKGLKEQELSNQIMASIISNYKCIFDSELTDPLGNVVIVDDQDSQTEKTAQGLKAKKNQSADSSAKTIEPSSPEKENNSRVGSSSTSELAQTPKQPSASEPNDMKQTVDEGHVCCPKHCETFAVEASEFINDEEDDLSEKENFELRITGDNGSDDDDDCDDGESYTPSSGSGSYCSSMDSQTLESSFDGDLGRENVDIDGANVDMASHSNNSSSECVSDTSYTPTSSHSNSAAHDDDDEDEDEQEESVYGNSSSFESSPSSSKLTKSNEKPKESQSSCLVCKRRESAQIEENLCKESSKLQSGKENNNKSLEKQQEQASRHKNEPSSEFKSGLHPPTARVSRKKRDSVKKSHHLTVSSQTSGAKPLPSSQVDSTNTQIINTDGGTSLVSMDNKRGPTSSNLSSTSKFHTTSSRHGEVSADRKNRHSTNKQAHRFDFMRRRSSSASSLGRIKHKRDQLVAAAQRKASKEDSQQAHHTRGSRGPGGERRRLHDVTRGGGHSSSRRSRGKGHLARKAGSSATGDHPVPTSSANRTFQRTRSGSSRHSRQKNQAEFYYEHDDVPVLKLPSQYLTTEPYLSCDFLSTQYLEELDYDKYFLLRSFNSDETLLRSSNYFSDFPLEHGNTQSRPRRFSNHDFQDKLNIIQVPCRPCDQIFEGFEEEIATPDVVERIVDLQHPLNNEANSAQPVEVHYKTSFISLLDNRLICFRKSELSINETMSNNQENSLLSQMKALKSLVRALKRMLKYGTTRGYSENMASIVRALADDTTSSAYDDDLSTCYVDHLSAKSLANEITKLMEHQEKQTTSSSCPVDSEDLSDSLSVKITLFRQRFNDLKNIRDHYLKYHAHQTASNQSLKNDEESSGQVGSSIEDCKQHGSLDNLRSIQSSVQQQRKLSAPNREFDVNEDEEEEQQLEFEAPVQTSSDKTESAELKAALAAETMPQCEISSEIGRPSCHYGSLCPIEFVFNIEKLLASKRVLGSRVVKLNAMTIEQLQSEKLELQKNLLRYEHWFGRPETKVEFSLVGHLYERYRVVKVIKSRMQEATFKVS